MENKNNNNNNGNNLHIAMLPWLAMGHLLPFIDLAKRLAQHGHHISFFSAPQNLHRLPCLPPHLSSLISFIPLPLPLPPIHHLPSNASATLDLPSDHLRPLLRKAFDSFQHSLPPLLHSSPPHWLLFDYAAHWAPSLARDLHIKSAFIALHNATALSFFGPPSALSGPDSRTSPEQFTLIPNWIPFPNSTITYRLYEAHELFDPGVLPDDSGVSESFRYSESISNSDFVAIRSCHEFESIWLNLLQKLYNKPLIPFGLLPPLIHTQNSNQIPKDLNQWLDKQTPRSVVYVAFGSEVKLSKERVREIALGLELSKLPFVWVLRASEGWLPEGFGRRNEGKGVVVFGWVPQVSVLGHWAVGGFLCHGGWGSIVEGLAFGVAMVMLPWVFDQGLNARNVVEKGIGVEVVRNEMDGSFSGEDVCRSLRLVMVDDEGECFRKRALEMKDVFGDKELHGRYISGFIQFLWDHR
ncbi:putative soyasaponin III rhamnosyltransferase [Dioscorea sansibarensis]